MDCQTPVSCALKLPAGQAQEPLASCLARMEALGDALGAALGARGRADVGPGIR